METNKILELVKKAEDKVNNTMLSNIRKTEINLILLEIQKEAINYSQCCTELKVGKKAEINKLSDLLKEIEDDEGFKLNNPIEWARRVGYLEGKINYICNL